MSLNQAISISAKLLPIENPGADFEYIILENIYNSADSKLPLRQRELAQIAGASLGMTNSILKRLAQKGWISVKRLNSRNIQYAVTLDGINEIIRRSYRYFKRTIKNVVFFKDILEDLVVKIKQKNINTVILAGQSDLDFIVEHACRGCGLRFSRSPDDERPGKIPAPGTFIIYSENIYETAETASRMNTCYLSRLIINNPVFFQAARREN